jgi:hypothetical protein
MQVILKITDLPSGSQIGPLFNVIPNNGVSTPAQVALVDLLSPTGVIVIVNDGVENITLQSIGGICSSSKKVTLLGVCGRPVRCCISDTTSTTTLSTPSSTTTPGVRSIISSKSTIEFVDPCSTPNPNAPSIQFFTLTPSNLLPNQPVTVQSPTSVFGLSFSMNGPWVTTLNFQTGPTGFFNPNPATIYVKFSPTATSGFSGAIGIAGAGASQINVAVSGNLSGSCTSIPLDFIYNPSCQGTGFAIDVPFIVGGTPPYKISTLLYTNENDALTDESNWLSPVTGYAFNVGTIPNGTLYMVIQDAALNKKVNSVVNNCNPAPTPTTTIPPTTGCYCYNVTNTTPSTQDLSTLVTFCRNDYAPGSPLPPGGDEVVAITPSAAATLVGLGFTVQIQPCPGCFEWQNISSLPQTITYRDCSDNLIQNQIVQPTQRICVGINNDPGTLFNTAWSETFKTCG